MVGDASSAGRKDFFRRDADVSVTSFLAPIQGFDDFNDPNSLETDRPNEVDLFINFYNCIYLNLLWLAQEDRLWMEQASLRKFAKHAVQVICSQQWVRDR